MSRPLGCVALVGFVRFQQRDGGRSGIHVVAALVDERRSQRRGGRRCVWAIAPLRRGVGRTGTSCRFPYGEKQGLPTDAHRCRTADVAAGRAARRIRGTRAPVARHLLRCEHDTRLWCKKLPVCADAVDWRARRAAARLALVAKSRSRNAALVMGITFVLASAAFGHVRRLVAYGGLFQRISVVTGFSFETSLGGKTSNNNAAACARESVAVSLTVGDEARLRPRLGADGFYGWERVACAHAEMYVGEWGPWWP